MEKTETDLEFLAGMLAKIAQAMAARETQIARQFRKIEMDILLIKRALNLQDVSQTRAQ